MRTWLIFFGFVCFGFVTGIMVFSILLKWHIDSAQAEIDEKFFDPDDPDDVDIHHFCTSLIDKYFRCLL